MVSFNAMPRVCCGRFGEISFCRFCPSASSHAKVVTGLNFVIRPATACRGTGADPNSLRRLI
jgi:hypothetical protein